MVKLAEKFRGIFEISQIHDLRDDKKKDPSWLLLWSSTRCNVSPLSLKILFVLAKRQLARPFFELLKKLLILFILRTEQGLVLFLKPLRTSLP